MPSRALGVLLLMALLGIGFGFGFRASGSCARRGLSMTSRSPSSPEFEFSSSALWLQGAVAKGYGRGSKKLGVPTANLPHFHEQLARAQYRRGVYFGWGRIRGDPANSIMPCVANIGISPTFAGQENPVNIVEAHLLDCRYVGDFYGEQIRLSLVGFIRQEQKFASLAELIAQIQNDIDVTRLALDQNNLTNAALNARRVSNQFLMATEWENETVTKVIDDIGGSNETTTAGGMTIWATAPISNEL